MNAIHRHAFMLRSSVRLRHSTESSSSPHNNIAAVRTQGSPASVCKGLRTRRHSVTSPPACDWLKRNCRHWRRSHTAPCSNRSIGVHAGCFLLILLWPCSDDLHTRTWSDHCKDKRAHQNDLFIRQGFPQLSYYRTDTTIRLPQPLRRW